MRFKSASRSRAFWGFSILLPDRLPTGSLLAFDDDPSQPIVALGGSAR
jgi:hypothetical protein